MTHANITSKRNREKQKEEINFFKNNFNRRECIWPEILKQLDICKRKKHSITSLIEDDSNLPVAVHQRHTATIINAPSHLQASAYASGQVHAHAAPVPHNHLTFSTPAAKDKFQTNFQVPRDSSQNDKNYEISGPPATTVFGQYNYDAPYNHSSNQTSQHSGKIRSKTLIYQSEKPTINNSNTIFDIARVSNSNQNNNHKNQHPPVPPQTRSSSINYPFGKINQTTMEPPSRQNLNHNSSSADRCFCGRPSNHEIAYDIPKSEIDRIVDKARDLLQNASSKSKNKSKYSSKNLHYHHHNNFNSKHQHSGTTSSKSSQFLKVQDLRKNDHVNLTTEDSNLMGGYSSNDDFAEDFEHEFIGVGSFWFLEVFLGNF